MCRRLVVPLAAFVVFVVSSPHALAQPIGTYRWQLQPYCNLVTLVVTQKGAIYTLEGTDDLCGAGGQASAIGTAFLNPAGTIGLGFSIVTAPEGAPVHVYATVTLPGASGTWVDSSGNSGTFTLTPGAGTGGSARPIVEPVVFGSIFTQPPSPTVDRGLSAVVTTDVGPFLGNGAGVFGQFGANSGWGSPGSAGVRGDSATFVGVLGSTNSGTAVRGAANTGVGVDALSDSGTALEARTNDGTTALLINNGAVKVTGTVKPAFVHTTAAANTYNNITCINSPISNGDPSAMVFVTYSVGLASAPGPIFDRAIGVFYDNNSTPLAPPLNNNVWCINTQDISPMPIGAKFNVFILKQ